MKRTFSLRMLVLVTVLAGALLLLVLQTQTRSSTARIRFLPEGKVATLHTQRLFGQVVERSLKDESGQVYRPAEDHVGLRVSCSAADAEASGLNMATPAEYGLDLPPFR